MGDERRRDAAKVVEGFAKRVPAPRIERTPSLDAECMLLQSAAGNLAVARSASGPTHDRIEVGALDDPCEREADQIADQVIRPTPHSSMMASASATHFNRIGRSPEKDRQWTVNSASEPGAQPAPRAVHEVIREPGQALDASTRGFMEPRFGRDFSQVRVHTGTTAEHSAREVSASAYAVGHHIVFGSGKFAPGTQAGNRLIAHELTHVVQQGSGTQARRDPAIGGPVVRIQRDPLFSAITTVQPGTVKALTPDQLRALNVDVGIELRRLAGGAITRAAEQFGRGCDAVKGELEKSAKQQAEIIAMMVDIAVGFAAPGLTAVIVNRAMTGATIRKLLVNTSSISNIRAASTGALDNLDNIEKLNALGLSVNPGILEKVSGDNLKATFTGAGKIGALTIKTVGPAKLSDASGSVVASMTATVAAAAQDLDRSLSAKSEEQLVALILALDASVANAVTYAAQIRAYLQQIMPIGTQRVEAYVKGTRSLVKLNAYGGPRLALIESGQSGVIFGTSFADFLAWVSPSLEESALGRAGLSMDQVPEFDPDKLDRVPRPALTESRILA